MLKKGKKIVMKSAMKLMMNERVGKTLMRTIQMKNDLNEGLAKAYAFVQIPSLADHQSVNYAVESVRRRVKGLEKHIFQAEQALGRVQSSLDKLQQDKVETKVAKPKPAAKKTSAKPKPGAKKAAVKPKPQPAKKATKKPVKKSAKKISKKAARPKSSALKKAARKKIAPLGATGKTGSSRSGGLLDLNFKK